MRDTLRVGFLVMTLLLPVCAHADFVVSGLGTPVASGAVLQGSPSEQEAKDTAAADAEPTHNPVRQGFAVATGFGDDVPLRFAVRQIVPKNVRIVYGPGSSPDTLVTWKGGQGWNWVLFRAVRPLGLRLVLSHMTVEIRK